MGKRSLDSESYYYGKLLHIGLMESDDGAIPVGTWLKETFPNRPPTRFNYRCCYIVDVDGKKLPNKLEFFAFRRGKELTVGEESDGEEESEENGESGEEQGDEQEDTTNSNSNNTSSTSSTGKMLTIDEVTIESLDLSKRAQIFGMDLICNKLGAKRFVGFMCKRFVDSKTYHYGKLLLSGLVEDDDGTFGVNNWLGKTSNKK